MLVARLRRQGVRVFWQGNLPVGTIARVDMVLMLLGQVEFYDQAMVALADLRQSWISRPAVSGSAGLPPTNSSSA